MNNCINKSSWKRKMLATRKQKLNTVYFPVHMPVDTLHDAANAKVKSNENL